MRSSSRFLVGSSISLFAILFSTVVFAQTDESAPLDAIRIEAGKILEIGTDTISTKSEFSWILTKDRKFQNAQRSKFFQTRLAQTGVYSLDISVQDTQSAQNEYHAFQIIVTDPSGMPIQAGSTTTGLKAVLKTNPRSMNGTLYVPQGGGIVEIDGSSSEGKITSYAVDLDSSLDTNGDGNPTNDFDNQNTYSSETGSPFLYFIREQLKERKITLTVTDAITGQTDQTSLSILFGNAPANFINQPVSDPSSPIKSEENGGVVRLSVELPSSAVGGKELLYEWNFGDGSRSLLTAPIHTYGAGGNYAVSLTVRDITNGSIVYQGSNAVQIATIAPSSSASSKSQDTSSGESQTGNTENAQSGFGSLLKVGFIVFLLLTLAIALYALFTWIKRKTAGKLVQTIENMEKTIVKSEKKSEDKVEPLKIKKESVAEQNPTAATDEILSREKSKTEFSATKRENVVPLSTSGPVPSWLQKASAPSPSPSPSAPVASPIPTPVSASPKTEKPTPQTAPTSASVPDWLKQAPKKTETVAEPKQAAPKLPEVKNVSAAVPAATQAVQEKATAGPVKAKTESPSVQSTSMKKIEIPSAPTTIKEELPKPPAAATQKATPAPQVQPKIADIAQKKKEESQKTQAPAATRVPVPETKALPTQPQSPLLQKPKTDAAPAKSAVTQHPSKPELRNIEKVESPAKAAKKPNNNDSGDRPIAIIKADSLM